VKDLFVEDLTPQAGSIVTYGWITRRRDHGAIVFLSLSDSTGTIQVVARRDLASEEAFRLARTVSLEAAVRVRGRAVLQDGIVELVLHGLELVGDALLDVSPRPHEPFAAFGPRHAEQILSKRHLYLRHPQVAAALRARHEVVGFLHTWFRERDYIEVDAPVLTSIPLYDDATALGLDVHGQSMFLTQCVGFYLEAAAHAFERVYHMGPSFRGEEGRSRRHMIEYWHVKAELAFASREDVILVVEDLLRDANAFALDRCKNLATEMGTRLTAAALTPPFPRISYGDALARLDSLGASVPFGESLSSKEEVLLGSTFESPFWIVGIPRRVEPFPYVVDPDDDRVAVVADLIAPGGYGELLGVAEKIHDAQMLDVRLEEKGRRNDPRFEWLRELRRYGSVPHAGFGMGLERLLRWLFQAHHVRDFSAFPRMFGRNMHP
jgi:asparaginyl-tRNA synthetase